MEARTDLERMRWVLALAALTLLAAGLFTVFAPFLKPLCWAVILVLSTWRSNKWLAKRTGRPALAALIMTIGASAIFVLVLGPILAALINEAESASQRYQDWYAAHRSEIPAMVSQIPFVGSRLANFLHQRQLADQLLTLFGGYQTTFFTVAAAFARGVLGAVFQIAICLFSAFFLYRDGEMLATQLSAALLRVGGKRHARLLNAVRLTVRGSVYGALVTAVAQGVLAAIGYLACDAPVPILLGLATMVLSPIPFGAPAVYLPAAALVAIEHSWLQGLILALWGLLGVSSIDNVIRPLFISQTTRMPLILVFFGIVGGVLGFGLLGIFLGPVLIAVAHQLWFEWIQSRRPPAEASAARG